MKMNRILPRMAILVAAAALAAGCAAPKPDPGTDVPKRTLETVGYDPSQPSIFLAPNDPWEGLNRRVYNFNSRFDRVIFLPAREIYRTIFPQPVRDGVNNAITNWFGEWRNFSNAVLQFRPVLAGRILGRFVVNSTLGIGGILDPAEELGLRYQREDFGQTLGRWGVGHGPYLVLPFWGPSSVRDGIGLAADWGLYQWINPFGLAEWESDNRLWMTPLRAIDARDRVAFQYYETGSPFEYIFVRRLYYELREFQVLE
jgi:phospholipid-binding lipoprotein MlaA